MAALRRAVHGLGWKITHDDAAAGSLLASTRMSLASWGERVTAQVSASGSGSHLGLSVALKFGLVGWGAQQRSATKLLDAVDRELQAPPPPPPPPA